MNLRWRYGRLLRQKELASVAAAGATRSAGAVGAAGGVFFTSAAKENISITKTIIKALAMANLYFFHFTFSLHLLFLFYQ